jgi:oligosaccharide repeat unit polymerase
MTSVSYFRIIRRAPRPLDPSILTWALLLLPLAVLAGSTMFGVITAAKLFGFMAIIASSVFVAALTAVRREAFDLSQFRLGGVYVAAFLVTMLLGTPNVYDRYADTPSALTFLATVCVGFVLTSLSIALMPCGHAHRFSLDDSERSTKRIGLSLAAGCCLVVGVYVLFSPVLPLIEVFRGARTTDLAAAREQALTNLSSPTLAYSFAFVRDIAFPVAVGMLAIWAFRRRTLARLVVVMLVGAVAALTAAITTEKSPVGRLILVVTLAVWIARRATLRWRALVLALLFFIIFPLAISRLSNSSTSSNLTVIKVIGQRVVEVPANVHYNYVEYVDVHLGTYLGGRTIPNIGVLAPGPDVNITADVQDQIFPDAVVRGNANASYLSNFYADFGWVGILLGSTATGLLISLLDLMNARYLPGALGTTMQALTAVQLLFLTSVSVFDAILKFPFGNLGIVALFTFLAALWAPITNRVSYRPGPNAAANAST